MPIETKKRLIDANLNRLREGIRVVEDIARYILNDFALASSLKTLRHKARIDDSAFDATLLQHRDIKNDILKFSTPSEKKRTNLRDIAMANFKRSEESARVLEEILKLDSVANLAFSAGNSSLGLHSADFANLGHFADLSPVSHPKFAKNHESQTENPSVVDSARNAQNLIKKDLYEAPENSPASWCKKSESKGAEVPPADFLLEAEKRGSPPKSEKAAAFWEHNKKELGGAGRGVQPFLREETSENNSEENAESIQESQNGLPRRFCESARNDNSCLDSANQRKSAESSAICETFKAIRYELYDIEIAYFKALEKIEKDKK